MCDPQQEPPKVSMANISRPQVPKSDLTESYFGSKLIQALAEYKGRFRNEFEQDESNAK